MPRSDYAHPASNSLVNPADYSADELELMRAIEDYKRRFRRPFPTHTEILYIAKSLGWRKVAEKSPITRPRPFEEEKGQ